MIQEQLSVPGYTFAIVGNAMQRNHKAAVEDLRMNVPALHLGAVGGRHADLLKGRVITLADHGSSLLPMPQWTVDQLDTGFADDHPGQGGEKNINRCCHQQELEQLTHEHGYVLEHSKVPPWKLRLGRRLWHWHRCRCWLPLGKDTSAQAGVPVPHKS